ILLHMEWNGMEWNGMEWNGRGRAGVTWRPLPDLAAALSLWRTVGGSPARSSMVRSRSRVVGCSTPAVSDPGY
ncbi:MAG TPA: hypothetical protein VII33_17905, partial [Nakamurella sp.]